MSFRLKALGTLVVTGTDGPITGTAAQRRGLALLVLIASAGSRGVTRDRLIGLLWPDSTDERARHAFSQTLYRLRLEYGAECVDGTETLHLDRQVFEYDVAEFETACDTADFAAASALYGGPFLDGLYLPKAPEFERWMERERDRLAARHREALEQLATRAAPADAARWWRSLAAIDPLNSRTAARLVEALAAAGDHSAALQSARVHESLVRQELDVAPTAEFVAAVARLYATPRSSIAASVDAETSPGGVPTGRANKAIEQVLASTSQTWRVAIRRRTLSRAAFAAVALVALVAVSAALAYSTRGFAATGPRQLAVGRISDFTGDTVSVARLLPEMLTTNLGRVGTLGMVSQARLYQLLETEGTDDPAAGDFVRAAERAGAHDILDGALYRRENGQLRLDVRIIDLGTGRVTAARQVEAADVFALADSATARIVASLGVTVAPPLRVSDVTTNSVMAFRFYEEGLRALRNRDRSARRLFDAALAHDTAFAMAAFGAYRASDDETQLHRAMRLSGRVTARERLLIRSSWANRINHPSRVAIAETLATRYAASPESHLELAGALLWSGDFAGGRRAARQAYAMDSLSISSNAARCVACEALDHIASAWMLEDSLAAAERVAREWIARDPRAAAPWHIVRIVLAWHDSAGALEAYERERVLSPGPLDDFAWEAELAIRHGNFAKAERLLQPLAESGPDHRRIEALWWLVISRRHQGRLADALALALSMRRLDSGSGSAPLHAQVLFESGHFREAASIFDSVAIRARNHREPSRRARHEGWSLLHKAEARAAAGDTAEVRRLADRLARTGSQSGYGRDPLLHHHLRGLNLRHAGRIEEAVAAFRSAMWSPSSGYTRTNLELGRALIDVGRPAEAIPVLRAALRSGLHASSLYATHTDFHALLARAFAAMEEPDSVRVHAQWVSRALVRADEAVKRHYAAAMSR